MRKFFCVILFGLMLIAVFASDTIAATEYNQFKCVHNVNAWEVITDATCVEDGVAKGNCTICCKGITRPVPAGHSFVSWEKIAEAKCVTAGKEQRVCRACGFVEEQLTPALGHIDFDKDDRCDACEIRVGNYMPTWMVAMICIESTILACGAAFFTYRIVRKKKV